MTEKQIEIVINAKGYFDVTHAYTPQETNCLSIMYASNLLDKYGFTTNLANALLHEYKGMYLTLTDATNDFTDTDPMHEPLCCVESVEDSAVVIDEAVKMYAILDVISGRGIATKTSNLQPDTIIPVTGKRHVIRLYDEYDGLCLRKPALTVPDMNPDTWIEKPLDEEKPI